LPRWFSISVSSIMSPVVFKGLIFNSFGAH
jgi:hypothetical protein